MLKVGLTGGIGCGKSTAAKLFADLGATIIDADHISRELVAPGQAALARIAQAFGGQCLNPDGSLDRAALRALVFSNPEAKARLEAILHPLIVQTIRQRLAALELDPDLPYVLVCAPLLLETGLDLLVDRVLVVDCPPPLQRLRAQARDQAPPAQLDAIIASQLPRQHRLSRADEVLDNGGDTRWLAQQVKKLHNFYLHLSPQSE